MLDKMLSGRAVVIGAGGGRGAAKSSGADRVELTCMGLDPGHVDCIVMRNYDQVRKYHIEPILRDWPVLEKYFNKSESRLVLPAAGGKVSQLDFSYAESLADVERRFRSANYRRIIVDQAEQFTEAELREMRNANRSRGEGVSRMLLLHNMGGVGIQTLRKWFHTKEYNKNEDPLDYDFIKVNPWDNVEWVRQALNEDGLSPKDYYAWPDAERKHYAATRGQYTRGLASQDETLAARDWEGDWNTLEGAYFGRTFDRQSTLVTAEQAKTLLEDWDERWMSEDWGKSHFNAIYWHGMTLLSPEKARRVLGWEIDKPVKAVVTYREEIVSEMTSSQVGKRIVERTPQTERERVKQFYLSPDAFGDRDDPNTIAIKIGAELRPFGMPLPSQAANDRISGWETMGTLLLNTQHQVETVWLISANCPQALETIPILMRDPKNLDDVLKTDKGQAKLEQDVADCFSAGTLIWTNRGQVPIESVCDLDKVMTRKGWKQVRHAWMANPKAATVTATFSDGTTVCCTKDHRFWTNRGFVPLDTVRYGDILFSCGFSNGTVGLIESGQMGTLLVAEYLCTARYGQFCVELSQMVGTFITLMATRATTLSKIWSALASRITKPSTHPTSQARSTSRGLSRWLKLGTRRQRGELGIQKTLRAEQSFVANESANDAESRIKASHGKEYALMPANQHFDAERVSTWLGRFAPDVDWSSHRSVIKRLDTALGIALVSMVPNEGVAPIYDLEIVGEHEFYANGILVHNCLRYGIFSKVGRIIKKPFAVELAESVQSAYIEHGATQANLVRMKMEDQHRKKAKWRRQSS